MAQFDESKAYVPQGGIFFDDGREEELLKFVTDQVNLRGSPEGVLKAIDHFGRTNKYLMNVGEDKGKIVADLIKETKPSLMIELGGYCGYSTILFSSAVRAAGGRKYFSIERSLKFAKIIQHLVEFAGLSEIVEVVVGQSDEIIRKLHGEGTLGEVDMLFLDHYKPAYATDLKLCEELALIKEGAVLVADNVITPGNPPYLEYVRSTVQEKMLKMKQERKADTENFPGLSAAQYVENLSTDVLGNPNLIYKSELVKSFEPSGESDGIEITRCLGVKKC